MENKNIKFKKYEILRVLLAAAKNKQIAIVTTGSKIQEEVILSYKKAFQEVGCSYYDFIPIKNKFEANSKQYISIIQKAGAVFFTGGDQFRLASILGGTQIIDVVKKRFQEDPSFLLAGTSAGSMVMGDVMLMGGKSEEAILSQHLKLSAGLGMIHGCIVDSHFIKRGRFPRLTHAVLMNPGLLGIGLGEDTALIVRNGDYAECRGSGMAIIIDGKFIKRTNVADAHEGEPIYVENLKVTMLVKGCEFSLKQRKIYKVHHE